MLRLTGHNKQLFEMTKSEVKLKIMALLSSGTGRSDTSACMSNQGLNDRTVAALIARDATPSLCQQHHDEVRLAMVVLLFACGIDKNHIGACNASLVLACVPAPRARDDFMASPAGSRLALAVTAGLIGLIAYVRYKIFPDMVVLGPRKFKGHPQFST